MLLKEKENLGEQKLSFTITVKGLQDLLGSIEFNEKENEFYWLDDNGKHIYKQMVELFKETPYGQKVQEEWKSIRNAYEKDKEAKKVVSFEKYHAKRFSDEFCEKYDHLI